MKDTTEDYSRFVSPQLQADNNLDLLMRLRERYVQQLKASGAIEFLKRLLVVEREIGASGNMPPSIERDLRYLTNISRESIDAAAYAARGDRFWSLATDSLDTPRDAS